MCEKARYVKLTLFCVASAPGSIQVIRAYQPGAWRGPSGHQSSREQVVANRLGEYSVYLMQQHVAISSQRLRVGYSLNTRREIPLLSFVPTTWRLLKNRPR